MLKSIWSWLLARASLRSPTSKWRDQVERRENEQRDDLSHLHQIVTQHWIHAEQVRWTSLNNYLLASTIILAAWTAVLVWQNPLPGRFILLLVLSSFGGIVSLLWLGIGVRGSGFADTYAKLGRKIEAELHQLKRPASFEQLGPFLEAERFREATRGTWRGKVTMYRLLRAVPLTFLLIYALLLFGSIYDWARCTLPPMFQIACS